MLDAAELRRRHPAYAGFDDATRVVWQPDGGFLLAERTIQAHVDGALAAGADLRFGTRVAGWEPTADGGVRVRHDGGSAEADRLVICGGPWMGSLVPRLAPLAVPERQVVAWLRPRAGPLRAGALPRLPDRRRGGQLLRIPAYEGHGFKFGKYHHFGEPIDPDDPDRSTRPDDEARCAPSRSATSPTERARPRC